MKTAPIGELTESVKTWNPSREPDSEFDYIDLSAVDNSSKSVTGATPTVGSAAPSRARQLVAAGDVLVSTVRPNLNAVAVVPSELDGATASTGFTVLRPGRELDGRFLFHWVRSPIFIGDMVRRATGASYPAVSDRIVKSSHIPAPPLLEQRRIAAVLDQADALRAKRRRVLTHLDALTQSIFNDMFGDVRERVPLGEALSNCLVFTDGDWVESKDQDPGGDVRLTQLADVGDGRWIDKSARFLTSAKAAELRCTYLHEGDVLVARMPDPLGRACIFPGSDRPSVTVVDVCIIRPHMSQHTPTWLMTAINSPATRSQIARLATGTTRSRVSRGNLAKVTIPVVSIDAQERFTETIQKLSSQEHAARSALSVYEALFASLQSRAFRGEL